MPGEGQKIDVLGMSVGLHIKTVMGNQLRAVDQYPGSEAMGQLRNLMDFIDMSGHIGGPADRHQFDPGIMLF